jgi:hypothetical protein
MHENEVLIVAQALSLPKNSFGRKEIWEKKEMMVTVNTILV